MVLTGSFGMALSVILVSYTSNLVRNLALR